MAWPGIIHMNYTFLNAAEKGGSMELYFVIKSGDMIKLLIAIFNHIINDIF